MDQITPLDAYYKLFNNKNWNLPFYPKLESFFYNNSNFYPKAKDIFRVFDLKPSDIKVVILGQDPYYNPNQADGLAFSVPSNIKTPPSLINIFKELKSDLGIDRTNPDLSDWFHQGVFLLNTALTVEYKKPNSHKKIWKEFTQNIISQISQQENIVFILWGNNAKEYEKWIAPNKFIIKSSHPSPLGARHSFFGSKPFSKTNNYLKNHNKTPIKW